MWRQERAKPKITENSAWEIIYDNNTRKPLYFNQLTKITMISRPRCLDSKGGGRLSIKQPVVHVLYKNSWHKGTLLGPKDKETFLVRLDDREAKVGNLVVHRNGIKEWSPQRKFTPTSTKFNVHNLPDVPSDELIGQCQKKLSWPESDEDTDNSLSKLSDHPRSFDCISWPDEEKIDTEYSPVNTVLVVEDSWGDRRLSDFNAFPVSNTEEDVESDEPLTLTPIKTFPKAQSKRRKERMNAVLLDWIEFKQVVQEDESELLSGPHPNNADPDSELRRPSIRIVGTSI